jgi:hypothetical protein
VSSRFGTDFATIEEKRRTMARKTKLTRDNILKKVYELLDQLDKRYVVCIDYRRSKGAANVNIGITKCELIYRVFDAGLDDWAHQPAVIYGRFEDSDYTDWWWDNYNHLKHDVEVLNEKAKSLA